MHNGKKIQNDWLVFLVLELITVLPSKCIQFLTNNYLTGCSYKALVPS